MHSYDSAVRVSPSISKAEHGFPPTSFKSCTLRLIWSSPCLRSSCSANTRTWNMARCLSQEKDNAVVAENCRDLLRLSQASLLSPARFDHFMLFSVDTDQKGKGADRQALITTKSKPAGKTLLARRSVTPLSPENQFVLDNAGAKQPGRSLV